MPIITIKVFENELTQAQAADLIHDITEAAIPYVGEVARGNTWVLIEEIKSGLWGIGGTAFGLADLRTIQQTAPVEQRPRSMSASEKTNSGGGQP